MATRVEHSTDRFFSLSLDMLCTAGFDGKFVDLNPSWTKTLGWSLEQLRSRPFLDFVHPDDRVATIQETLCLQSGVDTISFENRYRHIDGSYRWLASTTPLRVTSPGGAASKRSSSAPGTQPQPRARRRAISFRA